MACCINLASISIILLLKTYYILFVKVKNMDLSTVMLKNTNKEATNGPDSAKEREVADLAASSTPATAASLAGGLGSGLPGNSRWKDNMWVTGEPSTGEHAPDQGQGRLQLPKAQKTTRSRGKKTMVVDDADESDHSHSFSNCDRQSGDDQRDLQLDKYLRDCSNNGSGDENVLGDEEEERPFSKQASHKMSVVSDGSQYFSNSKKDR